MLDAFLNAMAGGAAANHDHSFGFASQASSNLAAASQHRECLNDGRTEQAAWWGGYAGRAADHTRHGRSS